MINLILFIIIILIVSIIVIIISLIYNNINDTNNTNNDTNIQDNIQDKDNYDDYLFHMSSEIETALRALNNILIYDKNFTFISLTQLAPEASYDTGIAKYDIDDITSYVALNSNYKKHFIQGFTELKEERNYMSHKFSKPLNQPIKIVGNNNSYAYLMQFERLVDNVVFYYIQISQDYLGGYMEDKGYVNISALLQYIIKYYPGEYIITGEFIIQGHEKIFEYHLGEENYHICSFYKYMTCNDNEGLAAPDGIVVSKKLYNKVQYSIDIYPGYSYQHYMITAKLYINGPIVTECIIDKKVLTYFEKINLETNDRVNLYNNPGPFDPKIHIGNIDNIKVSPFKTSNATTYKNIVTTNKLNSIK